MWQDKVKEVIDILENSNVNEIEVTFWGRKIRVVKNASNVISSTSPSVGLSEIKSSNFFVLACQTNQICKNTTFSLRRQRRKIEICVWHRSPMWTK